MRVPLLCALNFAVLAGGMTTTASDLSRPLGEPQLERPTLRSLGVYWIIHGDDNQNSFIGLEYRKAGSSPWRRVLVCSASSAGPTSWSAAAATSRFPAMAGYSPAARCSWNQQRPMSS